MLHFYKNSENILKEKKELKEGRKVERKEGKKREREDWGGNRLCLLELVLIKEAVDCKTREHNPVPLTIWLSKSLHKF